MRAAWIGAALVACVVSLFVGEGVALRRMGDLLVVRDGDACAAFDPVEHAIAGEWPARPGKPCRLGDYRRRLLPF